ncbi:MAG: efflux RND transporter periplasmic adaptor subunit [Fimbriimonadaceae bacterium]
MVSAKWAWAIIPVALLGFLINDRLKDIERTEASQKKEAGARRGGAASVEIATAQQEDIVQVIETVGTVTPEFSVNLAPRVAGRITYLEVREGERVKPGQVLVRIDPEQANAGVLSASASVNESRSRLAQAEATIQSNSIQVEQSIQQARAEATFAKSALVQAEKGAEARIAAATATVKQSSEAVKAAEVEVRNRRAQVLAAQANLKNADLKESRMTSLYEKGYVSAQERDNAVAAKASAAADLEVQRGEVESATANLNTAKARNEADQANLRSVKAIAAADIDSAKARLIQADASLRSAEAGRSQLPANQANISALKAGVDAADAQLKSAASQRSDTELRSSISGVITKRTGDVGSIASPGTAVLTLESTDSLYVDASIPVVDAAKIQDGDAVNMVFDGMPDSPVRSHIDRIVPSADPQDRQVLVRIRVPNSENLIKAGMFAKVKIETRRIEAKIVIPFDAVKKDSVTVIRADGKAETRRVVLGERDDKNVEILSGVEIGEKVVVLSFSPVKEGGAVTVTAERRLDGSRVVVEPPKKKDERGGPPPAGGK